MKNTNRRRVMLKRIQHKVVQRRKHYQNLELSEQVAKAC